MPINRSFEQFLADLDKRMRPPATSQNKVIQKVQLNTDTVFFKESSPGGTFQLNAFQNDSFQVLDQFTFVDGSFPKAWAGGSAGSTGFELAWSFGQWA